MTLALTDKLLFIYINSRSLRKATGIQDAYDNKVTKELEAELLLNWDDDMIDALVDDDDDLVYVFDMDNFICDPVLELVDNMDVDLVDLVVQATADAAWKSICAEFGLALGA